MENILVLGKKLFYMPAVSERNLERNNSQKLASNNSNSFEMKRHWSQSDDDIRREREIFQDVLHEEIKRGA